MIQSAGILLYRRRERFQEKCVAVFRPEPRQNKKLALEIFLVHPGGPFWAAKDLAAWSIPKGVISPDEHPLTAACREFFEETGMMPEGEAMPLGAFRLSSSKMLQAWAIEGEFDPAKLVSNSFSMVWPPLKNGRGGGKLQSFPEVDRGQWFGKDEALTRITDGQKPMLEKFFSRASEL